MDYLKIYLYLIVVIKFFFLFFLIKRLFYKRKLIKDPNNKNYQQIIATSNRYKNELEFVFKILMSLLLIYLFNPRQNNEKIIDKEEKLLIYIFGIVVIISSDWIDFFENLYV